MFHCDSWATSKNSNVYVTCNNSDRNALWEELTNVKLVHQNFLWCFIGDFNVVRRVNERKGTGIRGRQTIEIQRFNSFIENNLLMDTPIVGGNIHGINQMVQQRVY